MLQVLWGPSGRTKEARIVAGGREAGARLTGGVGKPVRSPGGTTPRPSSTSPFRKRGRPRKSGILKHVVSLGRNLTGPSIYEGFGQRKRAEKKFRSTNRTYTPGSRRIPVSDTGRLDFGPRRYPSISRVE